MDKITNMVVEALAGYLKSTPTKKTAKKKADPEEKKSGISVSQTVNVGHPTPMNEADMALGRMRKQPDWGLLKGGD